MRPSHSSRARGGNHRLAVAGWRCRVACSERVCVSHKSKRDTGFAPASSPRFALPPPLFRRPHSGRCHVSRQPRELGRMVAPARVLRHFRVARDPPPYILTAVSVAFPSHGICSRPCGTTHGLRQFGSNIDCTEQPAMQRVQLALKRQLMARKEKAEADLRIKVRGGIHNNTWPTTPQSCCIGTSPHLPGSPSNAATPHAGLCRG